MVPTNARAKLLVNKFVDAVAYLEDVTTTHTDPNLTSMKANLMRGGSDAAVSDDMVRVLEVPGIANAVDAHFRGTSKHHAHAIQAAFDAGILSAEVRKWFMHRDAGAGAHALGESDKGTVPSCSRASADASTCLCPVTAYLLAVADLATAS